MNHTSRPDEHDAHAHHDEHAHSDAHAVHPDGEVDAWIDDAASRTDDAASPVEGVGGGTARGAHVDGHHADGHHVDGHDIDGTGSPVQDAGSPAQGTTGGATQDAASPVQGLGPSPTGDGAPVQDAESPEHGTGPAHVEGDLDDDRRH